MKIKFNKIYIFDIVNKEAYATEFKDGINIITSSDIDGTDRGKSVLLRSLYHSLGADAHFDSKWNEKHKVYILNFKVDSKDYSIYRSQKLFKIFNSDNKMIFKTIHRSELSEFLGNLFDFSIFLPDKNTKQLVLAPPAYSFLLNFLDQDEYIGTKFNSFKNLAQFSNFKLNVIYSHLGIYDKKYFELIKRKEELEIEIKSKEEEIEDLNKMKYKILSILDNFSCPETNEALENELYIETNKYSLLFNEMNFIRNKLVDLRNQLKKNEVTLMQLYNIEKKKEKEINIIIKSKLCPECNSILEDTLKIRSKRYNNIDNTLTIKDNINIECAEIKKEITKNEYLYSNLVIQLEEYNKKIQKNQKDINDYIKFRGLNNLIDDINEEIFSNNTSIYNIKDKITSIKKELKDIKEKIKSVDVYYFDLIDKLKIKFELNELISESYEKLSRNFCASGSNKPLSTVMWYLTLNDLKKKFNNVGTEFPMVFDSPNNAETDQKKKHALVQYILDSSSKFNQLIISSIGFSKDSYKIDSDINIKFLQNNKYSLLNYEMYKQNYEILKYMNDA